jgi:hypothetical protein
MIHLGLHTDNWRPLSVGFEGACEKVAATGLKHLEFCAIHGQNFIAALGYDPGVSLQSNPRAIRRFLDKSEGVADRWILPDDGAERLGVWGAVRDAVHSLCR